MLEEAKNLKQDEQFVLEFHSKDIEYYASINIKGKLLFSKSFGELLDARNVQEIAVGYNKNSTELTEAFLVIDKDQLPSDPTQRYKLKNSGGYKSIQIERFYKYHNLQGEIVKLKIKEHKSYPGIYVIIIPEESIAGTGI